MSTIQIERPEDLRERNISIAERMRPQTPNYDALHSQYRHERAIAVVLDCMRDPKYSQMLIERAKTNILASGVGSIAVARNRSFERGSELLSIKRETVDETVEIASSKSKLVLSRGSSRDNVDTETLREFNHSHFYWQPRKDEHKDEIYEFAQGLNGQVVMWIDYGGPRLGRQPSPTVDFAHFLGLMEVTGESDCTEADVKKYFNSLGHESSYLQWAESTANLYNFLKFVDEKKLPIVQDIVDLNDFMRPILL